MGSFSGPSGHGGPTCVDPHSPGYPASSASAVAPHIGQSLLDAATGLRAALELAGDGLATASLTSLLDSEIALAAALAVLPSERAEVNGERDEILQELARARSALTRCRRLGGALSEMVRTSLGAQGRVGGYGSDGLQAAGRAPGALEAMG